MHIQTNINYIGTETIVANQYQPMKSKLLQLFGKYRIDLSCRMNFERQLTQLFNNTFITSIPSSLSERIIRERYVIQSIQYQLQERHMIVRRTADNQNTYYLGTYDEFEQACITFMNVSSSYAYVGTIDAKTTEQDHLYAVTQLIDSQLRVLHESRIVQQDYVTEFFTQTRTNLKLPRLYFLPEKNMDSSLTVQPRYTSYHHSPIQHIAMYVDRKIRSLFDHVCRSTSVINGDDFRERLSIYRQQNHLSKPTTLLGTFKIKGLYENMPHSLLLEGLNTLLSNPLVLGRFHRSTPGLLMELTSIVLRHNFFIYGNRVYRFKQGSPLNLALTKLLANIYIHSQQSPLWQEMRLRNLFYVRYNNEGILTWNESAEALQKVFRQFQQAFPDPIQLVTTIDKQAIFIDCHIQNCNGRFHTRVYHDSTKQPFVLPYFAGHPRIIYRQWYRFKMMRAVCYCSDIDEFLEERRYIEATFLANGFSLDMVEYLWRQFLQRSGFRPNRMKYVTSYDLGELNTAVVRILNDERIRQSIQGEEYKLISENKLISLPFYYDWGTRAPFHRKLQELWSSIITIDPIFCKNGFQIQLKSIHRYLSNTLLARPTTNISMIQMD